MKRLDDILELYEKDKDENALIIALIDRCRGLESVIDPLIDDAKHMGQWQHDVPEDQGQPDGETWAHYCTAMDARNRWEQLTGENWSEKTEKT